MRTRNLMTPILSLSPSKAPPKHPPLPAVLSFQEATVIYSIFIDIHYITILWERLWCITWQNGPIHACPSSNTSNFSCHSSEWLMKLIPLQGYPVDDHENAVNRFGYNKSVIFSLLGIFIFNELKTLECVRQDWFTMVNTLGEHFLFDSNSALAFGFISSFCF